MTRIADKHYLPSNAFDGMLQACTHPATDPRGIYVIEAGRLAQLDDPEWQSPRY